MLVPFEHLWLPAVVTICFGTLVLRRLIGLETSKALTLATLKAAIPFVYFGFYYDRLWLLLDDVTYFLQADLQVASAANPLSLLFSSRGREILSFFYPSNAHARETKWNHFKFLTIFKMEPFLKLEPFSKWNHFKK